MPFLLFTPNVKASVRIDTGHGVLRFPPGNTPAPVDGDLWNTIKDLPEIKAKLDDGTLRVTDNASTPPPEPTAEPLTPPPASVSVNQATEAALIDLPTIGLVAATKIIEKRPYPSLDDFQARAVTEAQWDAIKDLVTI